MRNWNTPSKDWNEVINRYIEFKQLKGWKGCPGGMMEVSGGTSWTR
jgi:hypothetical protein